MEHKNNQKTGRIHNILFLSSYLENYKTAMAVYIAVGTVYRLLPVLVSFLLSYWISAFMAGNLMQSHAVYFALLVILIVLRAIGRYADTWISHDIAYRILADLRIKLYYKIEALSPAFLKNSRSGDILAVMMEDVNLLEWFYAHTFGLFFITAIITGSALCFLAFLHPALMFCMLLWILALILIHKSMETKSEQTGRDVRNKLGKLSAELTDGVHGIKDIISLNWQKKYKKRIAETQNEYEKSRKNDNQRKGAETALSKAAISLASITLLFVTLYLVQNKLLSPIWYLVTITLSAAILAPVSELAAMTNQLGQISAAAARVSGILQEKPQVQDTGHSELRARIPPKIEFRNVTFTYPGESRPALTNVSFTIEAGEYIAFAGESGAGKSTIVSLLQRFYEYDAGDILINGISIRDYSLSSLRSQLAIVPQDVYLFNTSLRENLRMSRDTSTEEEIREAVKKAGAEAFIRKLPDGIETIAGEGGAKLSGGQKQRIAIARAFLKDSSMLILDEASSNLDSNNETYLNETLKQLRGNRTTIVIAHRISTLKAAERIIFIHNGKIADTGTFEKLQHSNSVFCEVMAVAQQKGETWQN